MKKYLTTLAIVAVLAVSGCCSKHEKVYFSSDSYDLTMEDKSELDKVVKRLEMNGKEKVRIYGYADATGSSEYNMELSKERAKSAAKYLTKKGIMENRITLVAYGDKNPVATNKTKEGRQENRRVEVVYY